MKATPSASERCRLVLTKWRSNLKVSDLEKSQLAGEIKVLDRQLERLIEKRIRIAVFGRVGVGKSSLLNALLGEPLFATDVGHGCTRHTQSSIWNQPVSGLDSIELVDTPGIDEIAAAGRTRLAKRIALQSDLVLLVIDSDLTSIERDALQTLLKSGKPVLLVLNRCDQWSPHEQKELIDSIKKHLSFESHKIDIQAIAASPRKAQLQIDGKVRSQPCPPKVDSLQKALITLLSEQGELLLALNSLRQADRFYQSLKGGRLKRSKVAAQGLIGRFAALKASGVAANPLIILDLAGGLAFDTALVLQLSKLYGLEMGGGAARQLLKRLSLYNACLGGAQLSIQLVLGILRQLLILATPISSGLSLGAAAPVALVQAALAVYTTKATGRLTAKQLLLSSQRKETQPSALLKRLATSDPKVKKLLGVWPETASRNVQQIQRLLP